MAQLSQLAQGGDPGEGVKKIQNLSLIKEQLSQLDSQEKLLKEQLSKINQDGGAAKAAIKEREREAQAAKESLETEGKTEQQQELALLSSKFQGQSQPTRGHMSIEGILGGRSSSPSTSDAINAAGHSSLRAPSPPMTLAPSSNGANEVPLSIPPPNPPSSPSHRSKLILSFHWSM
jgi:hypothetical protein